MPPENEEVVEGAVADEEAAPEAAEGSSNEEGAEARDAQVDEEDPLRAEAQAAANAAGFEGEVSDQDVQNYAESKQLEQEGPDEGAVPEVVEMDPVDESTSDIEEEKAEGADVEECPVEGPGEAEAGVAEGAPAPEAVEVSEVEVAAPIEGGGGDAPDYPTGSPQDWMNAAVDPQIPESSAASQTVQDAAAATGANAPQVQSANATQEVGFGTMLAQSMGDGVLGPLMPGFFGRTNQSIADGMSQGWQDASKGGWVGARGKIELLYQALDTVTKYTGPIGSMLGVVSFIRYIPIPPVMAVGNFLKAVSTFLETLTFILDVVKVVLGALKVVVGILAAMFCKDPEVRAEMLNNLLADSLQLAANGIAVGVAAATNDGFKKGWDDAGAQGSNRLLGGIGNFNGGLKASWAPVGAAFNQQGRGFIMSAARTQTTKVGEKASEAGISAMRYQAGQLIKTEGEGILTALGTTLGTKMIEEPARGDQPGGPWVNYTAADFQADSDTTDHGAAIQGAAAASQASLAALFDASTLPATDNPIPPESVPSAPDQIPQIQLEREVLLETKANLQEQKAAAIGGQEEGKGLELAADEHAEKMAIGQEELAGAKVASAEDAAKAQEDKAEYDKGKAESAKGKGKMGESGSGQPSAPGDASTDVPWYKKPFVWVIRKVNSAKKKVSDSITNAVTESVMKAAGFDDMDSQLEEAGAHNQRQQQVIGEEPAKIDEMAGVATKESADAATVKADAQAQQSHNAQVEAESTSREAEVDAQLAVLDEKEASAQSEEAAFEGTYAPTMEESKALHEKQQAEEIEPMHLPMDEAVAAAQEQVMALRSAMEGHLENLESGSESAEGKIVAEVEAHAAGLSPGSVTKALGEVERIASEISGRATSVDGERQADLSAIEAEIGAFAGQEATTERLTQLGELMGRLTSFGMEFDEERQAEMEDMHVSFEQAYLDLTSSVSEAA